VAAQLPLHPQAASGLALAVIASSNAPLVLLDDQLTVVAASDSFCGDFLIDAAGALGRPIFALGTGEWDVPQLRSLLKATVSGQAKIDAYEMDLDRRGVGSRRLVLKAQKLDYGDADNVRLLLTVSDVTDARFSDKLKDDLLREKAVLLEELQHRVANSLQIIASVLMQSARRAPSTEMKGHLFDAHNRVMSVAALQHQLAVSRMGDVELRAYFAELCGSIGASMIQDHDKLTLTVDADEGVAAADISVSLGLIVTELVINALKHAFPGGRSGKILVSYRSQGPDWTLAVSDNGVGMPKGPTPAKAGLGTSIVKALAKQLGAQVNLTDAHPGTSVSIEHKTAPASGVGDLFARAI
jgi:two-component sensor histidine kinase